MTPEERRSLDRIEALLLKLQAGLHDKQGQLLNLAERLERTGTTWAAHKLREIAAEIGAD